MELGLPLKTLTHQKVVAVAPPSPSNYFEIFGLEPTLNIDTVSLQKKYYELAKIVHPDKNAFLDSTQWSSLLNKAYQTLKTQKERSVYLLSLFNMTIEKNAPLPKDLAETYFEIQEMVVESDLTPLIQFKDTLLEKKLKNELAWDGIAQKWESTLNKEPLLIQLKEILILDKYLTSMLEDLEGKLK